MTNRDSIVGQKASPAQWSAGRADHRAGDLLARARELERGGCVPEAIEAYERAIEAATSNHERTVLSEACRRLGVIHFLGNDVQQARALCERSFAVATDTGHELLAAEALNALAGIEFQTGDISHARETFLRALSLGGEGLELRARIEQNLGILANIQGDVAGALAHYQRSLDACRTLGDEKGCAIAYHNLGMLSADRELWDDADRYYTQSIAIAEAIGDVHLRGLCLLNHSEVHLARQRYDTARQNAEAALGIFDQLGARVDKADAYKVIGVVFRETGRHSLAESRLRAAIEHAVSTGSVLSEAESSRELARLYQAMGRNQEALTFLNSAHRLFGRLDARRDLVDVDAKRANLEDTFLAIVRDWGQSIESADSYTYGHCERVAQYAIEVAGALGLDDTQRTTVQLGAYLHDLGKVRVPHEILNKAGPLTADEFAVMQMHPVWGLELLATVEFPWDLKPIIRWHHEKYDGSGYPDRLRGEEIPLSAQIICIVDVFDALTTTRSYRGALPLEEALRRMRESRGWWRPDVYNAFMRTVALGARSAA
ncbi:MAG TPA: HD domain-containing phosphohydrolase [Gemmatimonadaceae bacterium]|nr:HD domain-containing phosphohydrolase [Gemmatimonadaceae bacterium]